MKILITGISGFIGSRLATRLAERGHGVVGTGRGRALSLPKDVGYLAADLAELKDCQSVVTGVDAIIHCAGKAGAWGADEEYRIANVVSTANLLTAAQWAGVKRFVNISSPSIYFAFRHQFDLKETDRPARFSNAYAATKYEAETLVTAAHGPDFLTVSLRPRGVIGAGDRNWLPRIIAMRKAGSLVQPGDGTNLADFTSVENLLDAVELCLAVPPQAMGRTYNITNGAPEKLWDFIEAALRAVGLDGQRKRVPLAATLAFARLSEAYHRLRRSEREPEILPIKVGVAAYSMTLNLDGARNQLGYRPRQSTADGIQEFAAWWKLQPTG